MNEGAESTPTRSKTKLRSYFEIQLDDIVFPIAYLEGISNEKSRVCFTNTVQTVSITTTLYQALESKNLEIILRLRTTSGYCTTNYIICQVFTVVRTVRVS
jgi:hypothetical protein